MSTNFTITYSNYSLTYNLITGNTVVSVYAFTELASVPINVSIPSDVSYNSTNYQVTTIGNNAFINKNFLQSVTIPNSVTSIGNDAFSNGTILSTINIPNSVTSIGNSAFSNNSSLSNLTFPNNLISIPNSCCNGCPSLSTINIPNSVTSIGISAFNGCSSLESVTLPNNLTTIGAFAFSSNSGLTSINIPAFVTSIGESAFEYCLNLATVTFSQTTLLPTIGTNAFSNNASGRKVYCYSTITNLSVLTTGGTGVNFSDLNIINTSSNINYTLDNGTNTANVYGFNGLPTTITIPSSITISSVTYNVISIGDNAFLQCFGLESVIISSSVTSIGTSAFANIITLTTVTFLQNSGNLPDFVSGSQFNSIANPSTVYYSPGISNPEILGEPLQYFTNIEPSGPITCFKEGTKILTDKGYTPIQYLRKGTLVKTLKNGYNPIFMIGKKEIYHVASQERIKDQLYKCSKNEYPELFEDLIITGCHSILVNSFKEEQREKIINTLGNICITEGTYRLPACLDDKAIVYETPGKYTIYHFALEHDNYIFNYGVLANGLLVESCSKRYLKEISNMEMIE